MSAALLDGVGMSGTRTTSSTAKPDFVSVHGERDRRRAVSSLVECPDAAVARVLSRAVRALAFLDVTAQEPGLVDLIDEVMASWSDKPMCCEEAQKEVNFSFCGLLFHLTRPGCPGRKRVRQSRKLQAHVQCVQVTCEPFLDWPFAPDLLEVMGL